MIGTEILRLLMLGWDECVAKPFVRMAPKKSGRRILCFGDSNTWGSKPGSGLRYAFRERWPGVLQSVLGKDFVVIEEGRNGRTTVLDDPDQRGCNGKPALEKYLRYHQPLDLVIILLGTNDLKASFKLSAVQVAQGMEELGRMVLSNGEQSKGAVPLLLLVSPPTIMGEARANGCFQGADQKSVLLVEQYRQVAGRLGCEFFDAGAVIQSSHIDGVHWDREAHHTFGQILAKDVSLLF